jgi:hypothetical protein
LAFEGQAEFHLIAAGYASIAIYVYNPAPNRAMSQAGIHRMLGERLVGWRHAAGRGLQGEIAMLTAHPTDSATIAVSTTAGLFISRDGGDEFRPLVAGLRTTAARFALDGDAIFTGTLSGNQPGLLRVTIKDGLRTPLSLPDFGRDAVANVVQNPVRRAELALISFERAVFVSSDGGRTWKRIARPRGTLPGS